MTTKDPCMVNLINTCLRDLKSTDKIDMHHNYIIELDKVKERYSVAVRKNLLLKSIDILDILGTSFGKFPNCGTSFLEEDLRIISYINGMCGINFGTTTIEVEYKKERVLASNKRYGTSIYEYNDIHNIYCYKPNSEWELKIESFYNRAMETKNLKEIESLQEKINQLQKGDIRGLK